MSGEPAGGTGKWFATRTDEELQDIIDRNPANMPAYHIALGELERRNAAIREARQLRWIKATFWTSLILGVTAIAVALLKH